MMSPAEIDRAIVWAFVPIAAGCGCWFAGLQLSAMLIGGIGFNCLAFGNWKTQPGMWIFSGVMLVAFAAVYLAFSYFTLFEMQAAGAPFKLVLDLCLASSAMLFNVRFLWALTYWNRRMTVGDNRLW